MKKIISIMIVLAVIATAAFAADFNIDLGLGYGMNTGKVAKSANKDDKSRYSGFDIQLGFNAELNNHLVIYDNVNFVIPGKIESYSKTADKWSTDGDKDTLKSKFAIFEDLGVGYAFHFNAMRLILGGGFHMDYLTYKFKKTATVDEDTCNKMNIGVNVLIQGEYFFSQHFGAFLGLEPTFNFYNSWKDASGLSDAKGDDTATGFNGSFVIGATYRI